MMDQAHMTSLFENATEGILLTDSKGVIIIANPAVQRIFGYTEAELYGNKVEILLPQEIRDRHTGLRGGYYHDPGNRSMGSGRDLFGRNKSGVVFPVEVSLSYYKKDDEIFVIAFIVDITKRKETERNLINKQKELEQVTSDIRKLNTELEVKVDERTRILKEALEKLESSQKDLSEALDKERQLNEIKSRFVSMASHEFRTPLSSVLSSASLLAKYTAAEEQDKRDRHISRIKESVKQLNDILEDFLSLGRLDEGRVAADPGLFNIKNATEDTLGDMKLLLKPGQYFTVKFDGDETVFADKKLLKNILINLLSNAIKFSGESSEIKIETKVLDGYASVIITDHGIGISRQDQEHLFSSFFRGANALNIQGTGLGLHIVKRYIDLMKGTVALQSRPEKGTRVIISFPCTQNSI